MKLALLQKILEHLTALFLFVLPWQTVWIIRERFIDGVKWEYGTIALYAIEAVLWCMVGAYIVWFVRGMARRPTAKFSLTTDRLFVIACFIFLIYSAAVSARALDTALAFQWTFHALEALLIFFIVFLGPLPFHKAALWFAAGAVLPAVLGIAQFLTQSSFSSTALGITMHAGAEAGTSIVQGIAGGRWVRAYGPFAHPNVFGGYMALAIAAAVRAAGEWKDSPWMRLCVYGGLIILSSGLVFSFSRSAWIAAALALIVLCIQSRTAWAASGIVAAAFTLCVFIYFPIFATRVAGIDDVPHEIVSRVERIVGYKDAFALFMVAPYGVGPGNMALALQYLRPEYQPWEYQPVHNAFILLLVELGWPAAVMIFAAAVIFALFLQKKWGMNPMLASFMQLAPIAVLGVFDHYLVSSYAGLMAGAVFVGLAFRSFVPTFSTG